MKALNFKNLTLIAVVLSCLLQIGAQLFALSVVASTISQAPPRSFAMLSGEYGYDSSAFWSTVPPITFIMFLLALIFNWKTQRRKFILFALTLFVAAGLLAGLLLEPMYSDIIKGGYSDQIDENLLAQAKNWYRLDWMVWSLSLLSGLTLLVALANPEKTSLK